VHATIDVSPGEALLAAVGGGGSNAGIGTGGANGGGRGTMIANGMSAGGGGASDVCGGTSIGDRIIVGAGGGGAHQCAIIPEGIEGAAGGAEVGATYPATCSYSGRPAAGGEQNSW
jgi:hypothetical protein